MAAKCEEIARMAEDARLRVCVRGKPEAEAALARLKRERDTARDEAERYRRALEEAQAYLDARPAYTRKPHVHRHADQIATSAYRGFGECLTMIYVALERADKGGETNGG